MRQPPQVLGVGAGFVLDVPGTPGPQMISRIAKILGEKKSNHPTKVFGISCSTGFDEHLYTP